MSNNDNACIAVQVHKQRLCSQKHLLASMFVRLKQDHVKSSLRKKRIVHLLATGTKSKTHVADQPALTHLAAEAQEVDLRPMAITHSLGPNRSKLPPSVRLSEGTHVYSTTKAAALLMAKLPGVLLAAVCLSTCWNADLLHK